MITHAAVLSKFLGKIRPPEVVSNEEEEDYLTGEGMSFTNVVQHNMEISDSKTTSKTSYNKVRIVRI